MFEPEHDARVVDGIVELALMLLEGSKLPFVFQWRIELIAVTVDNVARTLLEVPRTLAYRPHDIGVDIDIVTAAEAGFAIVNVDSTVIAQAPKLAPHIPGMCARIAAALGIEAGQVNVKAKTAENLGPVGEGRAMEARAVALLHR